MPSTTSASRRTRSMGDLSGAGEGRGWRLRLLRGTCGCCSEERADVVADRAVRLHQRDQLPLVEAGARVREAHADPVAHLQLGPRLRTHPGVLVGEAGDRDPGGRADRAVPGGADHLCLGQVEVVRRVPLARVQERLLAGRAGDDLGPEAEGRLQGAFLGDPVEGGEVLVVAVVVGDVRAGAEQLQYGRAEFGDLREDVRHRVEPGAAARADDDLLCAGEPLLGVEGGRERDEPPQPRPYALRVRVRHLALVPGHAHQAQRPGRRHRVGHRRAVGLGPGAGARALARAELHDHVDGAGGARRAQGLLHQLDPAHGVDVTDEAELRVGAHLAGQPAQRDRVDQLVGEEDAADPVRAVDPGLVRHGGGDAPGAALQLVREELRGHGGLAVRGEGEAVALRVRLQQGEVVLHRLGGEGEDGGGEPAGEEVAALGGEGGDGQALGVGRERLEAVVDAFFGEAGGQLLGSGGEAFGCQGKLLEVRCIICNTHCAYRSTLSNIRADARSMVTTGPHADQRGAFSVRTRSRDGPRRRDHRCRLSR
ncbi:protein of unknown function [Streptomyces sp. KY75]|nr:protein of unknown function [Streptomyces sp. KY70]CAD5983738.1 protein of unknown function [Streptomyces sp. KY75]